MRDAVASFLLRSSFLRPVEPEDGLALQTVESQLPGAGRADIILVATGGQQLFLVETKLFANTLHGVEQLKAYRQWLWEHYPQWGVAATLIAQEFSPQVLEACQSEGLGIGRLQWLQDGSWAIIGLDGAGRALE